MYEKSHILLTLIIYKTLINKPYAPKDWIAAGYCLLSAKRCNSACADIAITTTITGIAK